VSPVGEQSSGTGAGPAGALADSPLVSLADIEEAARAIDGKAVRTPLLRSWEMAERTGAAEVRLKCENLQRTGSFKFRGAYNFLSRLTPEERSRGVITYSSGNHAQAVAMSARLHGMRAVVVMPTTAPAIKRERTIEYGGEVVLEGTTSIHRKLRAEAIAAAEGLVMVPPFDHPWIMAGQGTSGLEIAADFPEADVALICVGGGGLLSGTAAALKATIPGITVLGVEPTGAASMRAAWDAGEPVVLDSIDTIADGLAPVRTGDLAFRHARSLVDDIVTVEDDAIREATRFLVLRQKLMVEFSGAATAAAILSGKVDVKGKRVVLMVSGGNMDPSVLRELV
jgi:threo-3-hydroxy-L-aspartate ammonia-lyase